MSPSYIKVNKVLSKKLTLSGSWSFELLLSFTTKSSVALIIGWREVRKYKVDLIHENFKNIRSFKISKDQKFLSYVAEMTSVVCFVSYVEKSDSFLH